ncbi:Bifunctional polymyxin resistance protein ArnA [Kappamyces sp. JEL0680]|nr:Bifunctional polymyxin resistance protein ArnA [Kappamyces sp. JEL0680]
MRSTRLQLEYEKCDKILEEENIEHTIVVFGGARIRDLPAAQRDLDEVEKQFKLGKATHQTVNIKKKGVENSKYYQEAVKLGEIIGAVQAGAKTVGLNIVLPFEQKPNDYVTPGLQSPLMLELCFNFHYFSVRKMHFLIRCRALVAFPGGFGTLDELFEALTLIQTKKMKQIPIVLFGKSFWTSLVNFDCLIENGVISPSDTGLFKMVDTAQEAWDAIVNFYLGETDLDRVVFNRRV